MTRPALDPDDPLLKPLTMREVMEITGRSRDTIERWVREKRLTKYEERNRRGNVTATLYNEREVVDVEAERAAAARANHDRIRRRAGNRRLGDTPRDTRLDTNYPGAAS